MAGYQRELSDRIQEIKAFVGRKLQFSSPEPLSSQSAKGQCRYSHGRP